MHLPMAIADLMVGVSRAMFRADGTGQSGRRRSAADSEPQHVREDAAEAEGTDALDDGHRRVPAQQCGDAAGVSGRVRFVQFARPQCRRYRAGWRWGDTPRTAYEAGFLDRRFRAAQELAHRAEVDVADERVV